MVTAIVLAAGESRRMGKQNKLLLNIGASPMIRHIVANILGSKAGEVLVVCGYQETEVRSALHGLDVSFAHNPDYARGLSTSVQVGVRAASRAASGFMVCLGDLPYLQVEDYNRVVAEFEMALSRDGCAIVRPVYAGEPGHPVVFSAAFRREIQCLSDTPGCRNVVRRHSGHVRHIAWDHDAVVRDVDTPQAYQSAAWPDPSA